jgi:hypothetical protein
MKTAQLSLARPTAISDQNLRSVNEFTQDTGMLASRHDSAEGQKILQTCNWSGQVRLSLLHPNLHAERTFGYLDDNQRLWSPNLFLSLENKCPTGVVAVLRATLQSWMARVFTHPTKI